jgi:hypothetical protein
MGTAQHIEDHTDIFTLEPHCHTPRQATGRTTS